MRTDEAQQLQSFFLRYRARRLWRLYELSGAGLFIWRIYVLFRQAGAPVPPEVLAVLDQYADALTAAKTDRAVAVAVQQSTGARRKRFAAERNLAVMEQLQIRQCEMGQRPNEAARAVARDTGLKFGNVKRIKSEFQSGRKAAIESSISQSAGLQSAWLAGNRD